MDMAGAKWANAKFSAREDETVKECGPVPGCKLYSPLNSLGYLDYKHVHLHLHLQTPKED